MGTPRRRRSILALLATGLAVQASSAGESGHWSYTDASGPAHWAELSEVFALCGSGRNQSPIDIADSVAAELPAIELRYAGATEAVAHLGHTIQVEVGSGSSLHAEGVESELLQLHFHSPSEHRIDGEQLPLEAHFVHRSGAGDLSVVAVLFRTAGESSGLAAISERLPAKAGETTPLELPVSDLAFIPEDLSHFRYNGSLTTPPCSEGVRWYVLRTASEVSPDELSAFRAVMEANSRPSQARNARLVLR